MYKPSWSSQVNQIAPLPRLNVTLPNLAPVTRTLSGILSLAMLVAACGPSDGAGDAVTPDQQGPLTSVTTTPVPAASDSTDATDSTATAPETTVSDRPAAPDFTLALGDGGTYTLSDGEKPVYLIFWAEW